MGQETSQFLNCRFFRTDNSSEIKHQQLLKDLTLMQQENDQKKVLSLKQRHKSIQQGLLKDIKHPEQKVIANHEHLLRYSPQQFPKSMEYQAGGFIEIPEISLSDILETKLNTNLFFPPNDIHAMLGGLLSAMCYMQVNNIDHHDIYPSSIYYSNSRYKLSNPITTESSYERTFNQKRFSYLSPQLIEALVNGVTIQDHTLLFKPDVYSLGMVMLECCSLKSSSQCYDPESYQIIQVNIRNRLNIIETHYSISVCSLIKSMLEPDPKKRMSASQIFKIFQSPSPQSQPQPQPQPQQSMRGSTIPGPIDIPVRNIQRLPSIQGRQPVLSTKGPSQFSITVTPPPSSIPGTNSLNQSVAMPGISVRPPTFEPVRGQSVNEQRLYQAAHEGGHGINLHEIDNRIDRILSNGKRHG